MKRATNKTWSALLLSSLIFCASHSATASALFDDTNANFWLVNENQGQVYSYSLSATQWLDGFLQNGQPVYNLNSGESALVNQLENSSSPLAAQADGSYLPAISFAGLGQAFSGDASSAPEPDFRVIPEGGTFTETIEINIDIDEALFHGNKTLSMAWQASLDHRNTVQLTASDVNEEGVARVKLYLAAPQTYNFRADLYDVTNAITLLGSKDFSFTIDKPADRFREDSDGDGMPDLVEIAAGLDPLNKDWRVDLNGDGWPEFDVWLRSDNVAYLDANGLPRDTDGDGWPDFDEQFLRATNPYDLVTALPTGYLDGSGQSIEPDSEASRQALKRFQDAPSAGDLYEVEYLLDTTIMPTGIELTRSWHDMTIRSVDNTELFNTQQLLLPTDISLLSAEQQEQLPQRLDIMNYYAQLSALSVQGVRVPASESIVLSLPEESADALGATAPKVIEMKAWINAKPSLSPADFINDQWQTADEWRDGFIGFLADNLVQQEAVTVSRESTRYLALLELMLAQESQLLSLGEHFVFNRDDTSNALVSDVKDSLHSLSNKTLDQVVADLSLHHADYLADLVATIDNALSTLDEGERFAATVQSALLGDLSSDADLAYVLRLFWLLNFDDQIERDPSLLNVATDSDMDSLSNQEELIKGLNLATIPWLSDTDGDLIADNQDTCPRSAGVACAGRPQLTISASESYQEANGDLVSVISFQLDRVYGEDVTFNYTVDSLISDTASVGQDFGFSTGSITIKAGQRVASILVLIYDDDEREQQETFHVSVTDLQNANSDQASVVIAINDDDSPSVLLAGQLSVIPIEGLRYSTQTQSGITEAGGVFYYYEGETVTFSLGGTRIGSALGASDLTLFDLFDEPAFNKNWYDIRTKVSGTNLSNFNGLVNAVTLLQNLDDDADISNGIRIDPRLLSAGESIHVDLMSIDESVFRNNRDFRSLLLAAIEQEAIPETWQYKKRWYAMADLYLAAEIYWPAQVATLYIGDTTPNLEQRSYSNFDEQGNFAYNDSMYLDTDTGVETYSTSRYVNEYDQYGNKTRYYRIQTEDNALLSENTYRYDRFGTQTYNDTDSDGDGVVDSSYTYLFDDYNTAILTERRDQDGTVIYRRAQSTIEGDSIYTFRRETDSDGDGPNLASVDVIEYENDTDRQLFYGRDTDGDGEFDSVERYTYEALEGGGSRTIKANDTNNDGIPNSIYTYEYNQFGDQTVSITDSDGDGIANVTNHYEYNDNRQQTYRRTYSASSGQVSEQFFYYNALGLESSYEYYVDSVLRYSRANEFDVNGNQTAQRLDNDGDGVYDRQTEYGWDEFGNKVTERYDGAGDGIYELNYTFEYNSDGRTTLFRTFDADGNLTKETTYTYTAFSQPTSQNVRYIDANGDRVRVNETYYETGEESSIYSESAINRAAWYSILN